MSKATPSGFYIDYGPVSSHATTWEFETTAAGHMAVANANDCQDQPRWNNTSFTYNGAATPTEDILALHIEFASSQTITNLILENFDYGTTTKTAIKCLIYAYASDNYAAAVTAGAIYDGTADGSTFYAECVIDGRDNWFLTFENSTAYTHYWIHLEDFTDDVSIGTVWFSSGGYNFPYPPSGWTESMITDPLKNYSRAGNPFIASPYAHKYIEFTLRELNSTFKTTIQAFITTVTQSQGFWFYWNEDGTTYAYKMSLVDDPMQSHSTASNFNIPLAMREFVR